MFPALNKQIDKFADLIIKKGAHVAPRQTVVDSRYLLEYRN